MAGRGLDMNNARSCREDREMRGREAGAGGNICGIPKQLGLPIRLRLLHLQLQSDQLLDAAVEMS